MHAHQIDFWILFSRKRRLRCNFFILHFRLLLSHRIVRDPISTTNFSSIVYTTRNDWLCRIEWMRVAFVDRIFPKPRENRVESFSRTTPHTWPNVIYRLPQGIDWVPYLSVEATTKRRAPRDRRLLSTRLCANYPYHVCIHLFVGEYWSRYFLNFSFYI